MSMPYPRLEISLEKIAHNDFQLNLKNMNIPFDKPDTAKMIKKILQKADLNNILKKEFYDIEYKSKTDRVCR